jgi:DNA primase
MASSTTELIKEKLDIVEFLRGYFNIQPAGKNFKALCPFHKEKTASFMISPDRQSWHCFGCGLGGDIFGFLMRYENLEFVEALRVLAEKAGVELRRLDPAEHKYTGLLYELNNAAKDFFKKSLQAYEPAKKYLESRKLKPETIEEFEIGWAPNSPEDLCMNFLNSGYAPDDILRAGLALKTERGLLLDRFRGRIMFPIHNHFGKVVGFTGRVLPTPQTNAERTQNYAEDNFQRLSALSQRESAIAKYMNSPETPIFAKSRLLYGFWKSKNFIREAASVFMVEGQMDFLMSWQAGIKNVVATSGTALTADHLKSLRRLTEELVLSFDSDEAGSAAAERAIDLAELNDFSVKVASFGEFKDPAEVVEADEENLKNSIKTAVAAPAFYFEKYLPAQAGLPFAASPAYGRREGLKNLRLVLAKLKNIASPVERSFWLRELSKRTGLDGNILIEEIERINLAKTSAKSFSENTENSENNEPKKYSRREIISEELLRAVVAKNDFSLLDDSVQYLSAVHSNVFQILKLGKKSSEDPNVDELVNFIILGAVQMDDGEISQLKKELSKEYFKEKRLDLALKIKQAESMGDESEVRLAMEELNGLPASAFES